MLETGQILKRLLQQLARTKLDLLTTKEILRHLPEAPSLSALLSHWPCNCTQQKSRTALTCNKDDTLHEHLQNDCSA